MSDEVSSEIDDEMGDEIRTVHRAEMGGGEAVIKCPHCAKRVYLEFPIRGEQFQHKACGGWFEVSHNVAIAGT